MQPHFNDAAQRLVTIRADCARGGDNLLFERGLHKSATCSAPTPTAVLPVVVLRVYRKHTRYHAPYTAMAHNYTGTTSRDNAEHRKMPYTAHCGPKRAQNHSRACWRGPDQR